MYEVEYVNSQAWAYVWEVEVEVVMYGSPISNLITKYVVSNIDLPDSVVISRAQEDVRDDAQSYRPGSSADVNYFMDGGTRIIRKIVRLDF